MRVCVVVFARLLFSFLFFQRFYPIFDAIRGEKLIDTIFINNVDEALVREQIDIVFKDFEKKIQKEIDACITEDEIDDLITSL